MYNHLVIEDVGAEGFLWDRGNAGKNWEKHRVKDSESEEVFFDEEKIIFRDVLHSEEEERFILLGRTKKNRLLFLVFTKRGSRLRVISARGVNRKERKLYEKTA